MWLFRNALSKSLLGLLQMTSEQNLAAESMSVPPPPLLEEAEAEAENSNDEAKAPGEAMKEEEDSSDNEADAGWIEGKSGLDFKIMCLI